MTSAIRFTAWLIVAGIAAAAGIAATFGNFVFGLGPLLWPLMRLPYDETYPEAPTERLLLWICAVTGVAIGLAVFLVLSRSRFRIAAWLRKTWAVA